MLLSEQRGSPEIARRFYHLYINLYGSQDVTRPTQQNMIHILFFYAFTAFHYQSGLVKAGDKGFLIHNTVS